MAKGADVIFLFFRNELCYLECKAPHKNVNMYCSSLEGRNSFSVFGFPTSLQRFASNQLAFLFFSFSNCITLGPLFLKVPKTFRTRKAICRTPTCLSCKAPTRLFCKAGLFICVKGIEINNKFIIVSCLETPSFWRYKENYGTRNAPKVSRLWRNVPLLVRNFLPLFICNVHLARVMIGWFECVRMSMCSLISVARVARWGSAENFSCALKFSLLLLSYICLEAVDVLTKRKLQVIKV